MSQFLNNTTALTGLLRELHSKAASPTDQYEFGVADGREMYGSKRTISTGIMHFDTYLDSAPTVKASSKYRTYNTNGHIVHCGANLFRPDWWMTKNPGYGVITTTDTEITFTSTRSAQGWFNSTSSTIATTEGVKQLFIAAKTKNLSGGITEGGVIVKFRNVVTGETKDPVNYTDYPNKQIIKYAIDVPEGWSSKDVIFDITFFHILLQQVLLQYQTQNLVLYVYLLHKLI